ncbi:KH_dom_type_1 domain-containing protein [Pycnococcus provasolii]
MSDIRKTTQRSAGAVYLSDGSPSTFTLCTFQFNHALSGEWGGYNVYVIGDSSYPSSASFYACTFLDYRDDSDHGVRKGSYTAYSSFTFYDNAPPLPPSPPSPPPPPLTYSYATGSWSSCSASCDGGTQTRSVTCQRSSDSQVVSDSYCSGSKPSTSQSCNENVCPPPSPSSSSGADSAATVGGVVVGVLVALMGIGKQYDNFGKISDVTSFGTSVGGAIGTAGEAGGGGGGGDDSSGMVEVGRMVAAAGRSFPFLGPLFEIADAIYTQAETARVCKENCRILSEF